MKENAAEILKTLMRERLARKESERILELKSLEIYEQKLEIDLLRKKLDLEINRKYLQINKTQSIQQEVFEAHPFSILIYSIETLRILNVNQTAVLNYGYSKEEFSQMDITNLHDPKDRLMITKHIELVKKGTSKVKKWSHIKKNGDVAIVKITGVTIEFENEPARIVVVEDITELIELEKKNENHEKRYISLIDKSSDLIFGMQPDGLFLFANDMTCQLTGYTETDLLKKNFSELIRPDYQRRVVNFYKFQLESKTETTYTEFPIVSREGEEIWLGQSVNISKNKDEKFEISAIARVITEKKAFEKALLRSEDKFRSIIENMELGLLETNRDGVIVKAYKSFCKIVGYEAEELEGTNGRVLLDDIGLKVMTEQRLNRVKGETGVYEIQLVCKGGFRKWVMVSGAPFYDQNNRVMGSIGIHLDITERKNIEDKLTEAKNIAESSLKAKDLFLANISHEIRTPLNAIIGLSEVLAKSQLELSQNKMINEVSIASRNLLGLIDDLLLLSKVASKHVQLDPGIHSIKKVLQDTAMMFSNGAKEKGIDFEFQIDIDEDVFHEFDKLRFIQIIQNLLSNAIKFTSNGFVKLRASTTNEKNEIKIVIEDTGIGIPENELDKIFQGFIQGSNNDPNLFGGTGLGLSIVKSIVQAMDGTVKAHNLKNGTCFTLNFSFPIKEQPCENINSESSTYDIDDLKGIRVLVAEDNAVNQLVISEILTKWEVDYVIVKNGLEAVELIRHKFFDVVLMDIRMPIMNGVDAAIAIRNDQQNYKVRIIALTANNPKEGDDTYWEAGINNLLIKPFIQNDLLTILVENYKTKLESLKNRILSFTQNDFKFANTLRIIFIEDTEKRISVLKKAAIEGNLQLISDVAHNMKPSLQQLASIKIQELNFQLENIEFSEDVISDKIDTLELHLKILIEDLKELSF